MSRLPRVDPSTGNGSALLQAPGIHSGFGHKNHSCKDMPGNAASESRSGFLDGPLPRPQCYHLMKIVYGPLMSGGSIGPRSLDRALA